MQVVFHIDLNAFYASAEISRNPDLKGKPIVISGKSRRSIITTASYEAREFGIHSAMPLFQALELCKDLCTTSNNWNSASTRFLQNNSYCLLYTSRCV